MERFEISGQDVREYITAGYTAGVPEGQRIRQEDLEAVKKRRQEIIAEAYRLALEAQKEKGE